MSTNDGNTPVDVNTDDLEAFEKNFFQTETVEDEVVEEVVEDVEDAPETDPEDDGQEDEVEAPEDEESEDEPEPEPKKSNRKSAKERIQELANERREERDARIAAETRLADLEARLAQQEKTKQPDKVEVAVSVGPDPDAVDDAGELVYPLGEFDPKFVADLTRYNFKLLAEEAKVEAAKAAEDAKAQEESSQLEGAWNDKLVETEATLPDLREKLAVLDTTFRDVPTDYGNYLAETIMRMDRGPEVLYYLANNIDEAQKIVASGHVAATLALGRLEGLMADPVAPEKRNEVKVSKAPVPAPASRGTAVGKAIAPDTDDLGAFELEFYGKQKR